MVRSCSLMWRLPLTILLLLLLFLCAPLGRTKSCCGVSGRFWRCGLWQRTCSSLIIALLLRGHHLLIKLWLIHILNIDLNLFFCLIWRLNFLSFRVSGRMFNLAIRTIYVSSCIWSNIWARAGKMRSQVIIRVTSTSSLAFLLSS